MKISGLLLSLGMGTVFVSGAMTSAAYAAEIRITETATVSGFYSGGPAGSGSYTKAPATLTVYGDLGQQGTAWGPNQDIATQLPDYNTIRAVYAQAQIGSISGPVNQNFFGGVAQVIALSNANAPFSSIYRISSVTEIDGNGQLQPGGFAYSTAPAALSWNGTSNLAPTTFTSTETQGPGTDAALKNGTQFDFRALSPYQVIATVITGATANLALVPNVASAKGFGFSLDVDAGQPVYIDPVVASGYDYVLGAGSPLITQALFPTIPGSLYSIYSLTDLADPLFANVLGGTAIDFTSLAAYAQGIDGFELRGINAGANLDPNNPTAFVTGLTFASDGHVDLSQNPLTTGVPEPATWGLMLGGLGLVGSALRASRRRRSAAYRKMLKPARG